ncbi:MAG: phenylalanine--tRNA ligase subunit beta [Verrucomicrobiota bacterium]
MKTSLQWLSMYVPVPDDPRELTEQLTLAGLEVEGIDIQGSIPDGVVVGEILSREPHPDADRLSVCQVNVGNDEPLQIVCGAPNCNPGSRVPVATVGTVLGEDFKINKAKLRGVASRGMMCSADELGLGNDHSGLLILPDNAQIGTPAANWLDSDVVVDWEVTPNRPDWLSHIGIARETAAVYNAADSFKLPDISLHAAPGTRTADVASVDVRDGELCPRYIARVIRNVTIAPSPEWMQSHLRAVGLRPINNIVDITNFVLLECGQPLHAFDHDRLRGGGVIVRRATPGETMTTLDDQTHKLTPNDLLIADCEGGVAMAGIMGGANSEISETTTNVLLESAVFDPATVRATARRLGLNTDSSHRFERGVSFEMAEFASRRAAALLCELAGGELLDEAIDVRTADYQPHCVDCRPTRVNRLLGTDLGADTMVDCLRRLQLPTRIVDDVLRVEIPSFRLDLEREADIIEEIARIHGLANIPAATVRASVGGTLREDAFHPQEKVRAELLALGLDEAMNYSYMSREKAIRGTGAHEADLVVLSNPLSADTACLRPSLLPGMIDALALNIARGNSSFKLFEIGRVFSATDSREEHLQAALLLYGPRHPERFGDERLAELDFFDLKGILQSWIAQRRLDNPVARATEHPAFESGRAAELTIDNTPVAVFGQVAGSLTADIRLQHPAFLALVDLDTLLGIPSHPATFTPLPQYPSTVRDISLLAPASVPAGDIRRAVLEMNIPNIEAVNLADVYEDPDTIGAGQRSLTFSITYRHPERTLKDSEVNQAQEKVRTHLTQTFQVQLR